MLTLLASLWIATAFAEPPPLVAFTKGDVSLEVPDGWKTLVKEDVHNVTITLNLATTITIYWYDLQRGVTNDILLDVLMETVNQNLPIGEAVELSREDVPGFDHPRDLRTAKRLHADVNVGMAGMAYTMKVGAVTIIDAPAERVIAAFVLAPPDEYASIGAIEMLTEVATSLHLATDPALPVPAWWWKVSVPDALARHVETAP